MRWALGIFWVDAALRYEFRYSAHPLSFQYLGSACGGLISADYPYLRQTTECAADLVIGSLERRFQRRMSHRLQLYIQSDLQNHQWRSSENEAMASRFNDAA